MSTRDNFTLCVPTPKKSRKDFFRNNQLVRTHKPCSSINRSVVYSNRIESIVSCVVNWLDWIRPFSLLRRACSNLYRTKSSRLDRLFLFANWSHSIRRFRCCGARVVTCIEPKRLESIVLIEPNRIESNYHRSTDVSCCCESIRFHFVPFHSIRLH